MISKLLIYKKQKEFIMDPFNSYFFGTGNELDEMDNRTANVPTQNDINGTQGDSYENPIQTSYNPSSVSDDFATKLFTELASSSLSSNASVNVGIYQSPYRLALSQIAKTIFLEQEGFRSAFPVDDVLLSESVPLMQKIGNAELRANAAAPLNVPGAPPVGFDNTGYCNCWANALLQLIFSIPAYEKTYLEIADLYAKTGSPEDKEISEKLYNVFMIYHECAGRQLTVPRQVAQEFRLALNMLTPLIPNSPYIQFDPHEALSLMLETYQRINTENWKKNPLFSELKVTQKFIDVGSPILSTQTYTSMPDNKTLEESRFQAILDFELPKQKTIDFGILRKNFFNNPQARLSDQAYFQIGDGIINAFKKTEEQQIFAKLPNFFLLSLKRFGFENKEVIKGDSEFTGNSEAVQNVELFKIMTKTDIPLQIVLTPQETGQDKNRKYELTNFIVHQGGFRGGHYIHYRKYNGKWMMLNDAKRALISEEEIKNILAGNVAEDYTSYLHFYTKTDALQTPAVEIEKPVNEELMEMDEQASKAVKSMIDRHEKRNAKHKSNAQESNQEITGLVNRLKRLRESSLEPEGSPVKKQKVNDDN